MSVLDYLLDSLIKHLQKKQKARKLKRKGKRISTRKKRLLSQSKSSKKKTVSVERRKLSPKIGVPKTPVKKNSKKSSKAKKKKTVSTKVKRKAAAKKKKSVSTPKKKVAARRPATRPKVKSNEAKETKKAIVKSSKESKVLKGICIGEITHFFGRIQVVVLKMTADHISVGNTVHIKGEGTDFLQKVGSLQIESIDVKTARKGQLVGLKVSKGVNVGSKVYKITK